MSDTPTTMAELRARIDSSYAALEQTIAQLSDEQMIAPIDGSWSAKDLLAHVAAWQQVMMEFHVGHKPFEQASGLSGVPYASTPVDQINESFYARDKGLPLEQVLASFRGKHQQLLDMLERMPEADLYKEYTPAGRSPDSGAQLIEWIIGDSYDHYDEHRATLERVLGEQAARR